jgi:hypothetical protein
MDQGEEISDFSSFGVLTKVRDCKKGLTFLKDFSSIGIARS